MAIANLTPISLWMLLSVVPLQTVAILKCDFALNTFEAGMFKMGRLNVAEHVLPVAEYLNQN